MKQNSNRTHITARPGVRVWLGWRILSVIALSTACGTAVASDSFAGVSCSTNIAKVMLGRHLTSEPVDKTQARHKDLNLKTLGGDELDWGFDVGWVICGEKYFMLVDDHSLVKDVLKLPSKSEGLQFQAVCKGPKGDQDVVGILQDQPGAANLPAKAAWKIDDSKKKFAAISVDGLTCPRNGILGDGSD